MFIVTGLHASRELDLAIVVSLENGRTGHPHRVMRTNIPRYPERVLRVASELTSSPPNPRHPERTVHWTSPERHRAGAFTRTGLVDVS